MQATNGTAVGGRSLPLLHYKDLGLSTQNRKVRFTCVHASDNFLACGANNGSVYLYATSAVSRSESDSRIFPAKYHLVKMITPPSNDRVGVTCLSICPQQKRLVVGTMRGVVYGIQLSDYNKIGEKVDFSHDFHAGFPITCFLWDKRGQRLFSACNGGSVCQTVLRAGVSAIFGSVDTELLLKEETGIVQLDLGKKGKSFILLVSSQLRVLLLNLTSGDGSAVQIGTKARQGSFGACFFTSLNPESIDPSKKRETKVFSSRPGRRVWVADPHTGTVSSTLKFSLAKNPTAFLQNPGCASTEAIQPRDLSINKLRQFRFIQDPAYAPKDVKDANVLLVSWNIGSSVIFFLDPSAVEIVEWHIDLGIILDLKIINETTLIVLHGDVPRVSLVRSCSAQEFIEIYGAGNVTKKIELAIDFSMNDAIALRALREQWTAYQQKESKTGTEADKLSSALKGLLANAESLEKEYLDATANEFSGMEMGSIQPMQVIFKQRPQVPGAGSEQATPDLFATTDGAEAAPAQAITLGTGALHKPIEYFDVLAPSEQSYTKSISAPDGSTLEARLIEIPELARTEPVIAVDFRESYMDEVLDDVKTFERLQADDGTMNNLLPALRDGSSVAVKAFSTLIPNAAMFSNLMDTSMITQPFQKSAGGLFGTYQDLNDDLVLDPDPRLFQRSFTFGQRMTRGTLPGEYSALRIAMSTADSEDDKLDTEVLMEAISMNIWDTNLKYTSNLPISEQLNLPDAEESSTVASAGTTREVKMEPLVVPVTKSVPDEVPKNETTKKDSELTVQTRTTKSLSFEEHIETQRKPRLTSRNSLSPDAGRGALRALQKYLGATPSCEVKRRCIVGGRIAHSPELDPIVKREVSELMSELFAASETAETTKQLSKRLWPASGITRVCACLTNVFLLQGDLVQAQAIIEAWLNCFDPSAQKEDPIENDDPTQGETDLKHEDPQGFARGEALVDGDGLPLTRNDWNLVRTLVSTYFAISAAGVKLQVRPLDNDDGGRNRIYEQQMGIAVGLQSYYMSDSDAVSTSENDDMSAIVEAKVKQWSAAEAEAFVKKYGVYLNPDLAAEACNLARFKGALTLVLDQVVSGADMVETCDDIKTWVGKQEFHKALETLKERDSFCLLLHLLDLLMTKCPQEAIEICVEKYPVLYPGNVEYSLFGKEIQWDAISSDGYAALVQSDVVAQTARYFRYLVRLLEVKGDEAGRDRALVNRCLELCFAGIKVTGNLFELDERGGQMEWIAALVAQPERFAYEHQQCWELFLKHEALDGMIELLMLSLRAEATMERGVAELHSVVGQILERGELRFFGPLFSRIAALPHGVEDIQVKVLEQVHAHLTLEKTGSSGVITKLGTSATGSTRLSEAAIFALLNFGDLEMGMQLLARFPLLFASAPLEMYHTIVETHVVNERQKHEVNQMLEIADTNAWASYKEASIANGIQFPPQLAASLLVELGSLKSSMDAKQANSWKEQCKQFDKETAASCVQATSPTVALTKSAVAASTSHYPASAASLPSRSFEYRNSGWGGEVQLHDSVCAMCELPVFIIADGNSNLDVVLLPCGHAFHGRCVEEEACPACLDFNMSTLDFS